MSIFIIKLIMKQFIKEKLNILLEAFHASQRELENFRYKMVKYYQLYKGDEYMNSPDLGDGVYRVVFNKQGKTLKGSRIGDARTLKSSLGPTMSSEDSPTYIAFNIAAGRGIEHPDTYKSRDFNAQTRDGSDAGDLPGSPYSDAVIKTILAYGEDILDFMGEVKYTDGNSGAERAKNLNDPEFAKRMSDKLSLSQKQKMSNLFSSDKEKELINKKEDLNSELQRLKRSSDKESRLRIRDIRSQIDDVNKEIKNLSSGWDEFKRSDDKSIGI
jgi:hypothetical protein